MKMNKLKQENGYFFIISDKVSDENGVSETTVTRTNYDGTVDCYSQLSFRVNLAHLKVCVNYKIFFVCNI